jgi:hypothetical protein
VIWFLLLGNLRSIAELARTRRGGRTRSDADQLAGLTHVPAVLWVGFFAVVAIATSYLAWRVQFAAW